MKNLNFIIVYGTPHNKDTYALIDDYVAIDDYTHDIMIFDDAIGYKSIIKEINNSMYAFDRLFEKATVIIEHNYKQADNTDKVLEEFKDITSSAEKKYFYESYKELTNRLAPKLLDSERLEIKRDYKKYGHVFASYKIRLQLNRINSIISPQKKNCIVADMDSTICLNIQGRDFFDTTDMCNDVVNQFVVDVINNHMKVNKDHDLVIITGRFEENGDIKPTTEYIKKVFPQFVKEERVKLYMRNKKDHSASDAYKSKVMTDEIVPVYNVKYALDDDLRVINVYRELGIPSLWVNDFY